MPDSTIGTNSAEAGPAFRAARRGAGLSVRALARQSGVDHSTISRWERGEREISHATYEHLSLALGDYLAGRWAA
jgi:transcriptional regulator with XRE-family HTH domain